MRCLFFEIYLTLRHCIPIKRLIFARGLRHDTAFCSAGVSASLAALPARYLGTISAPDQASAITKAIEFFHIAEHLRFRVAAEQIIETQERVPAKAHRR
jgi:hypothetical protein